MIRLLVACSRQPDPVDAVVDTGSEDAQLVLGDVRTCAEPVELGWEPIDLPDPRPRMLRADHGPGASAVVADLDEDGAVEIALSYFGFVSVLAGRESEWAEVGALVVEVATLNLARPPGRGPGLLLAKAGAQLLELQDGQLLLSALELDPGYTLPPALTPQRLVPADVDGDGLEELFFLMNRADEHPDSLLRYGGELSWRQEEALPADTALGNGFDARWFDWDLDGDLDLYVANDHGSSVVSSQLYRNVEGRLEHATDSCSCGVGVDAMGVDAGDFNRDGLLDLFVTASSHAVLLAGADGGAFVDVTAATDADQVGGGQYMGWGGVFGDLDNDGWLDIVSAQGDLWDAARAEANPAVVFEDRARVLQQIDGSFVDRAEDWGFDRPGSWRAVVLTDLNDDGVLDPLVTDVAAPAVLYLSRGCTEGSWLEVYAPPGARVTVSAEGAVWEGWTTRQSSYAAGHDAFVHLGLGEVERVDRLVVTLTDGTRYERSLGFEGRRRVVLELD